MDRPLRVHVCNIVFESLLIWTQKSKYWILSLWKVFHQFLVTFRFKLVSTTLERLRNTVWWGLEQNWTPIQLHLVLFWLKNCSESKFSHMEFNAAQHKNCLFVRNFRSNEWREKFAEQHKPTALLFWSFTEPETKFCTTKFKNLGSSIFRFLCSNE